MSMPWAEQSLCAKSCLFSTKDVKEWLEQMLLGGSLKLKEAGALLAGGHSIYDHEPKYGLAVTGEVHPENLWHNNTPQVGMS